MPSILHEIDSDGDLIVVLKEANTLNIIPDVYVHPPPESENPDFILDFTWLRAHRHVSYGSSIKGDQGRITF